MKNALVSSTTGCFKKCLLLVILCLVCIYILSSASVWRLAGENLADLSSPRPWKTKNVVPKPPKDQNATARLTSYITSDQVLIPDWFQEYLQWHKHQRTRMTPETVQSGMRLLLMECWPWNPVCGGTADRLRPLPVVLWVAHQTNRLLLIKWGRPAELEEFLVPPQGGLDWRVPHWLIPHLANQSHHHAATRMDKLIHLAQLPNETLVTTRLQVHDYGSKYYNAHHSLLLREVYRGIWNQVFVPTLPIAALIADQLHVLDLEPGHYAAAHVRARYTEQERDTQQLQVWAQNAVNCASQLRPGGPILVASDSIETTKFALDYGKTRGDHVVVVVALSTAHQQSPLHLDKATTTTTASQERFYDTFVDLYLLGMSRCLTYNIGGYGKWGLMLGYNSSCGMRHQKGYGHKKDGLTPCTWVGS